MPERERRVEGQGQPCSATAFYHYAPPPPSPPPHRCWKSQERTKLAATAQPVRLPARCGTLMNVAVSLEVAWTSSITGPWAVAGAVNSAIAPLPSYLILIRIHQHQTSPIDPDPHPQSVPSMRSLVGSKANACNSSGPLHLAPCPLRIGFLGGGNPALLVREVSAKPSKQCRVCCYLEFLMQCTSSWPSRTDQKMEMIIPLELHCNSPQCAVCNPRLVAASDAAMGRARFGAGNLGCSEMNATTWPSVHGVKPPLDGKLARVEGRDAPGATRCTWPSRGLGPS
ncbi:hypothetical protein S7711_10914 [Stachybotrys chartarum IBT 7711]|uniref:Uncharacterized protein n=1 Tax=Stachybotrys chartarum (strain CBS 109288 / IBT 7711) TaxID=1280523 RepID=A0A084AV50_STACB|nr:hypothetical protein S7711_10914 [Stachybotrys chartarum IBT 7711]